MNISSKNNASRLHLAIALVASSLTGLTACGGGGGGGGADGGGDSSATVASGQIYDSLIEGLHYSSGSVSGLTDVNGNFDYEVGTPVTFSVGGIVLGSVEGSDLISIPDFVEGVDTYDEEKGMESEVLNIAQFLQTIDADPDPSNGIHIDAATRAAAADQTMEFDLEDWDLDPGVNATLALLTANPMVSEEQAAEHGNAWLAASHAGEYEGTWSRTDDPATGSLWFSIGHAGNVTCICEVDGEYLGGNTYMNGGTIDADGAFDLPLLLDGDFDTKFALFTGDVSGSEISGNWVGEGPLDGQDGSFTASLTDKPMAFVDLEHIGAFSSLAGSSLTGEILDDEGEVLGDIVINGEGFSPIGGDFAGRYPLTLWINPMGGLELPVSPAIIYLTAMDGTHVEFAGFNDLGFGFSGSIGTDGVFSGTWINVDPSELGGTFSGQIEDPLGG